MQWQFFNRVTNKVHLYNVECITHPISCKSHLISFQLYMSAIFVYYASLGVKQSARVIIKRRTNKRTLRRKSQRC